MKVCVQLADGPTHSFELDGAPKSLDRGAVEEFLKGLDLPDEWIGVEFTDLESGDFVVATAKAQ